MTVNRGYDVTLQSSFLTPGGDLFVGSGIPGTHFVTATDSTNQLQFGLQVEHRQGAPYSPFAMTADGADWHVNPGTQIGNPARAEFNYEYSVGVTNGGSIANVLTLHDIYQQIKVDGQVVQTFQLVDIPATSGNGNGVAAQPEHLSWVKIGGGAGITDDGQHSVAGKVNVTQNSENPAFLLADYNAQHGNQAAQSLADFTAHGAHTIDVSLLEYAHGTSVGLVGVAPPQMVDHAHVSW